METISTNKMTAKEKAKELVEKYINIEVLGYNEELDKLVAVECAKISVNEILLINHNVKCDAGERLVNAMVDYYEDVKNELENY